MNLNFVISKSLNLNLLFLKSPKCSLNLNLISSKSMNLNSRTGKK